MDIFLNLKQRKIQAYLAGILEDAMRYRHDKRPGRRQKKTLNKDTTEINRGVELLLRRRKKPEKPKTFQVKFGNLIAIWNKEIIFHFNFYLDIRKK